MIKRISAALLALTMAACIFTGCSKKDESSNNTDSSVSSSAESSADDSSADQAAAIPEPSLTIDGKKIDTTNFTVCTVDGVDIDFDTFRYYYFSTLSMFQTNYGVDISTINATEGGYDTVKASVIDSLKQKIIWEKLAKENKITLTDAEKKTAVDDSISNFKANYSSEEEYQNALKATYLTEETYKDVLETQALYQKVTNTLLTNDGKYATKKADFRKIVKDGTKYCREIHVMIPYCAEVELSDTDSSSSESDDLATKLNAKYTAYTNLSEDEQKKEKEKAKKTAEEVLKKAQNGDDFATLIKNYGWDVSLDETNGNYLNKTSSNSVQGIPQELIDASFALKENEVSKELAENSNYGYFIIKRLPVDMDYVEENIDDLIYIYDSPNISKTLQEMMDKMEVSYCDGWDKITSDSIT